MAVVFVKQATSISADATQSFSASFGSATTAGNLLVLTLAGDKNTGNLTAAGWTILYNQPSSSVSYYLAWKVSAGETTVTVSTSAAAPNGAELWIGEYSETGTGAWTLLGQAVSVTDEVARTTQSTGTTAAVAQAGLAIASAAADSQPASTAATWSNGFVTRHGLHANLGNGTVFVAEKQIAQGGTAQSTVTADSDQMTAAVAVFARSTGVAKTLTGTVTATSAVSRRPGKVLAGSSSPTAAVRRTGLARGLAGSVTPAGSKVAAFTRRLAGTVASSSPALVRGYPRSLSGTVTPTGAIARTPRKRPVGTVTPSGLLKPRNYVRRLAGLVAAVGSLSNPFFERLFGRAGTATLRVSVTGEANLSVYLRHRAQLQVFTAGDAVILGAPFTRSAYQQRRAGRPHPPSAVTAQPRYQAASVSFVAGDDGGSPITGYTVTASTGQTAVGPSSPVVVTGLTNGVPVTFYVTETNAIGESLPSPSSAAVTPAPGPPDPPRNVTASAGNGQATVSFTAPNNNGGSNITGYTVSCSNGQVVTTSSSPVVVTGLTNGTSYTFVVTAQSAAGTSGPSDPSLAVTPATIPSAPTITGLSAAAAQVTVSFAATSTGGAPITSWTVTAYVGSSSTPAKTATAAGTATSATVTGLTNGTAYTFTVTATNKAGTSAASARSSSATPAAPKITTLTATTGTGTGSTLQLTKPAGATTGTVLIAGIATNGYDITSAPSGWTRIGSAADAGNPQAHAYYRVLTSSDATVSSWTWTIGGTGLSGGGIQGYLGVSSTVLDVPAVTAVQTASSSASISATLSPATSQAMLVGVVAANSGVVGFTPPAGWTSDYVTGSKSSHQSHYAAAGNPGSVSYSWRPSDPRALALVAFVLRPSA